jgi:ferredoxin-type protein NapH
LHLGIFDYPEKNEFFKKKSMKPRMILFMISIIMALCMIVYGGSCSTYKVYEMAEAQNRETPFYDWFKETEIIVGSTFSGVQRTADGRMVTLSSYRSMMDQKLWKYCPIGTNTPLFFCKLCPSATIQSALPWAIIRRELPELIPGLLRMTLFLVVMILATANLRAFCKMLCPLGALIGIFNKFSFLFVIKNDTDCNNCRNCEQECPMEIAYDNHDTVNERRPSECVLCAECSRNCSASRRLGIRKLSR